MQAKKLVFTSSNPALDGVKNDEGKDVSRTAALKNAVVNIANGVGGWSAADLRRLWVAFSAIEDNKEKAEVIMSVEVYDLLLKAWNETFVQPHKVSYHWLNEVDRILNSATDVTLEASSGSKPKKK